MTDFFTELKQELKELRQSLIFGWEQAATTARNAARQLQQTKLDYVHFPIGGPLPERAEPPRGFIRRQLPLPLPPLPMQIVNRRLQAIADANNVKGVLFHFHGFDAGRGTLQNLRQSIRRLRAAGKEAIVYTPYLDMAHAFVAAAADRIIIPPGAMFDVLGLRTETIFLKEALARIGVQAEVIQISPYKSAYNMFGEADMTPEQREQLDWLLDDMFESLALALADGRGKSPDEIRALIDGAPYTAVQALELGLVDGVAYEDELAELLGNDAEGGKGEEEKGKAKLLMWEKAWPALLERARRESSKFIGVISLEGMITMGPSRQPPLIPLPFMGGQTAGAYTLLQLLRRAEKMEDMAALILHVDSGGGSALASELIAREIERIKQKKPVLAYMGNTAASGGYYVSVPASHIMCQPNSVTGSIGVIMMRTNTQGLYEKLSVKRVAVERGKRAGLYRGNGPLSDDERETLWRGVVDTYEMFKRAVADGRSLPYDELDPICEGRVWTGRQALAHKLVDSHGDFVDAVCQAAELAGLPTGDDYRIPVVNLYPKGHGHLPPEPFEPAELPAEIGRLLSGEWLEALAGRPLMMMPFEIKFK